MKNDTTVARVIDTQKIKAKVFGHQVHIEEGSVHVGDKFSVKIDSERRAMTRLNHSAAHLMQSALRKVLGEHVLQRGSWVGPDVCHFDFTHNEAMTVEQIQEVEDIVNREILANTPVKCEVMPIEEAKKSGALMLFGEKYGETVRVLTIGSSIEFCGGTHVTRTGDIGSFKVLSEGGIAAGIRRIEMTTGMNVVALTRKQEATIKDAARVLKTPVDLVVNKAETVFETVKSLEKQITQLKTKLATAAAAELVNSAKEMDGYKLVVSRADTDAKSLRGMAETLRDKLGTAVVVLACENDGKVQVVAAVSKSLIARMKAGEIVSHVAQVLGGKGGGKPDLAMAGASDATHLGEALAGVEAFLQGK